MLRQTSKGLLLSLLFCSLSASAKTREFKKGEMIIQWYDEPVLNFADSGVKLEALKNTKNSFLQTEQTYLADFGDLSDKKLLEKIEQYKKDPNVKFVEPNFIVSLQELLPNDERFMDLWGLKNIGNEGGVAGADIAVTHAWEQTTGSRDVTVAVIDTGVDYNHPDLKNNIWQNSGELGLDVNGEDKRTNGIDDDGNGYVDDWHGWDAYNSDNDPMDGHSHGTHCAGTIGAEGDNEIGVVGVNWKVSIIPVKIFSDKGSTSTDAIVRGISYANTVGAHVQSNSWGGGAFSNAVYDVITEARDVGAVFVAASGNNYGNDNDTRPFYPSSYDVENIVSVASIDKKNRLSSFSNKGPTSVDVAAPGSNIISTVPNNAYASKSGTSMATPHVAGVLALIKSKFKDLDYRALKSRLLSTSKRTAELDGKIAFGLVSALDSLEVDELAPSRVEGVGLERAGLMDVTLSFRPSGDDLNEGEVSFYEFRVSSEKITTNEQWQQARTLRAKYLDAQEGVVLTTLTGFELGEEAYVTIAAFDNVGNRSVLSESYAIRLKEKDVFYLNEGDSVEGFEIVGDWATKTIDGVSYITDSPDGNYENNSHTALTSPVFEASSSEVYLELDHKYNFEKGYDKGIIEIKVEGSDVWSEVKLFTSMGETSSLLPLYEYLTESQSFRLRFRVLSDASVTRDGWKIRSFSLVGAK